MRAALVAVVVLLLVAFVVVILMLVEQRDLTILKPTTGQSSVLRSADAAPEPGGAGWVLPERQWDPLPGPDPASPLHAAQSTLLENLPPVTLHGCPEPATTPTKEAWMSAVRAQWSCVHASWVPVFEELGWVTGEPEVSFYPGQGSESDCGYLRAPAFYCSYGEGSVHFGAEHFDMAKVWDLAVNEMVNHEYGHHLQKLAGITATKLSLPATNDHERRAELQATCWSAMMTVNNSAFGFNEEHLASWEQRLETMREDALHGTRASLRYWGTRGLYAEILGDCNTWVATDRAVA